MKSTHHPKAKPAGLNGKFTRGQARNVHAARIDRYGVENDDERQRRLTRMQTDLVQAAADNGYKSPPHLAYSAVM